MEENMLCYVIQKLCRCHSKKKKNFSSFFLSFVETKIFHCDKTVVIAALYYHSGLAPIPVLDGPNWIFHSDSADISHNYF